LNRATTTWWSRRVDSLSRLLAQLATRTVTFGPQSCRLELWARLATRSVAHGPQRRRTFGKTEHGAGDVPTAGGSTSNFGALDDQRCRNQRHESTTSKSWRAQRHSMSLRAHKEP
jgi:hypothetical protein